MSHYSIFTNHYSNIKDFRDFAELLTDSQKSCAPFYHEVFNCDLAKFSVLNKLLDSIIVPAWLLIARFIYFHELYKQEISTDHGSTQLDDCAQEF